jgi:hypothetical protein
LPFPEGPEHHPLSVEEPHQKLERLLRLPRDESAPGGEPRGELRSERRADKTSGRRLACVGLCQKPTGFANLTGLVTP